MDSYECCICDEITIVTSLTNCGHVVCESCTYQMCTTKCPLCREDPMKNGYITNEILEFIQIRHEEQLNDLTVRDNKVVHFACTR